MCKSGCSDSGVQLKSRKRSKLSCPSKMSNKPPHHRFSGPSHWIAGQASARWATVCWTAGWAASNGSLPPECCENHFWRHDTLKLRRARKLSMWQHDSACGQVVWRCMRKIKAIRSMNQRSALAPASCHSNCQCDVGVTTINITKSPQIVPCWVLGGKLSGKHSQTWWLHLATLCAEIGMSKVPRRD